MIEFLLSVLHMLYIAFLVVFIFGVTVFIHEFGHFIVARSCGLVVRAFSIGFGPAIFKWESKGIVYKIGCIPFGGYVALPQLDPEGMERVQGSVESVPLPPVSPWKKIAVAVAGPFGNIVLAVVLALIIWAMPWEEAGSDMRPVIGRVDSECPAFAAGLRAGDEILSVNGTDVHNWYEFSVETLLQGKEIALLSVRSGTGEKELKIPITETEDGGPTIDGVEAATACRFGGVVPDSPADLAGVQGGDFVLSFNGTAVLSWDHFTEMVQNVARGATVALVVDRAGEEIELSLTPEYNEQYDRMMIGVQLHSASELPWMLYRNPIDQIKFDALAIVRVLQALVTPSEAKQAAGGLGGPIAIFSMLAVSIKMGVLNTFGLIRFLNINLAMLNLLPIPVLDGGHVIFSLWEGITHRKVNAKVQVILINIFAVLLISAMLVLSVKDIDRQFNVKRFFTKPAAQSQAK